MQNLIFNGAGDTIGKQLVRAADSVAANLSACLGCQDGKNLEGFISKRINISFIMQEGRCMKQKPGLQKHTIGN